MAEAPEPKGWRAVRERPLSVFNLVEDLAHFGISLGLICLAGYVLYHTAVQMVQTHVEYATRITNVINGVLLVIIITELLRTVLAHFESEGYQLQPFLIIGIISAVRHILTIGAELSAGSAEGPNFTHTQIELGVSAGVALVLVTGLLLVRVSDRGRTESVD
jgi:uncharacterized membrane protein (DUF373 family)